MSRTLSAWLGHARWLPGVYCHHLYDEDDFTLEGPHCCRMFCISPFLIRPFSAATLFWALTATEVCGRHCTSIRVRGNFLFVFATYTKLPINYKTNWILLYIVIYYIPIFRRNYLYVFFKAFTKNLQIDVQSRLYALSNLLSQNMLDILIKTHMNRYKLSIKIYLKNSPLLSKQLSV